MQWTLRALLVVGAVAEIVNQEPKHLRHGHHAHPTQFERHDANSREVQDQVERMVDRVKQLQDGAAVVQFAEELNNVEMAEEAIAEKAGDRKLVEEIDAVRADLCVTEGFAAHQFQVCEGFMRAACNQSTVEHRVSQLKCTQFFQAEQEAGDLSDGAAPATAPAGAPSAPSAPGPALFGGKHYRKLPEQGVHGKKVIHKDFDTMTGDWHLEFGPNAGHRSYWEICADHPHNEWCCLHGYCPTAAPGPSRGVLDDIAEVVKRIVAPAPPSGSDGGGADAGAPSSSSKGASDGDDGVSDDDVLPAIQPTSQPTTTQPTTMPPTLPWPWLFPWHIMLLIMLLIVIAIIVCLNVCGR